MPEGRRLCGRLQVPEGRRLRVPVSLTPAVAGSLDGAIEVGIGDFGIVTLGVVGQGE